MSGIETAFFGVLGRDADLKTSKAGRQYLKFSVRVGAAMARNGFPSLASTRRQL